jgi:hypothetical protein
MDKEPAETQMANYGGAMSVKTAKKKLNLDMAAMSDYSGGAMCGGSVVPDVVRKAVDEAKKLIDMWRKISAWINSFESDLQDEIIDNPKSQPNLVDFAKQLKAMLNNVKVYQSTLDSVASALSAVGLGRGRKLKGGISIQDVGKYAGDIAKIYMWFKNNKPNLDQVLKLKSLQPYGQQVLDAVNPIFGAVGLGRGGAQFETKYIPCATKGVFGECVGKVETKKVGGRKKDDRCSCDSMEGGMMSQADMEKAARAVAVRPSVRSVAEEAAAIEARRASHKRPAPARGPVPAPAAPAPTGKGRRVGGAFTPEEAALAAAKAYNKAGKAEVTGGRKARAPSARGEIVKQIMRERGVSLPEASKIVKSEGLY